MRMSACRRDDEPAAPRGRRRLRRRPHRPRPGHRYVPRRARRVPASCPTPRPPARRRSPSSRAATLARLDEAERQPGADSDIERRCAPAAARAAHRRTRRARRRGEPAGRRQHAHRPRTRCARCSPSRRPRRTRTGPRSPSGCARCRRALDGYRESLALGLERKLYAGPRPTATFIEQLTEWSDTDGQGRGWFEDFASAGPDALRAELDDGRRARRPRPWSPCATGCATCTRPRSRARRTRWAASGTPAGRATSTARISTSTRRTRTAGPSTTGSSPR